MTDVDVATLQSKTLSTTDEGTPTTLGYISFLHYDVNIPVGTPIAYTVTYTGEDGWGGALNFCKSASMDDRLGYIHPGSINGCIREGTVIYDETVTDIYAQTSTNYPESGYLNRSIDFRLSWHTWQ